MIPSTATYGGAGDKTHLYAQPEKKRRPGKKILVSSPEQLDTVLTRLQREQQSDISIIDSSSIVVVPGEAKKGSSPSSAQAAGQNPSDGAYGRSPLTSKRGAAHSPRIGGLGEFLILPKQEPEPGLRRASNLLEQRRMRRKMRKKRVDERRLPNAAGAGQSDLLEGIGSTGSLRKHGEARLSQRVHQQSNRSLSAKRSLQQQGESESATHEGQEESNEARTRSKEAELIQRIDKMIRVGAALKPVVGRDHHCSDKASLISSGNVANLVVFKDEQAKQHHRHASMRQVDLLLLHDQQKELVRKTQAEKKSIIKKYNRNLLLEARDEARQLKQMQIFSPSNRRTKPHNLQLSSIPSPFSPRDMAKGPAGLRTQRSKEGPTSKRALPLPLTPEPAEEPNQNTLSSSKALQSTGHRAQGKGLRAIPRASQSEFSNQAKVKQYPLMPKIDKIIQENLNRQVFIEDQDESETSKSKSTIFRNLAGHLRRNSTEQNEQDTGAREGRRADKGFGSARNKLIFSQQHLERLLSSDGSDLATPERSLDLLQGYDSLDANEPNRSSGYRGILPNIQTTHRMMPSSSVLPLGMQSPRSVKHGIGSILHTARQQKEINHAHSILSLIEPQSHLTKSLKHKRNNQMEGSSKNHHANLATNITRVAEPNSKIVARGRRNHGTMEQPLPQSSIMRNATAVSSKERRDTEETMRGLPNRHDNHILSQPNEVCVDNGKYKTLQKSVNFQEPSIEQFLKQRTRQMASHASITNDDPSIESLEREPDALIKNPLNPGTMSIQVLSGSLDSKLLQDMQDDQASDEVINEGNNLRGEAHHRIEQLRAGVMRTQESILSTIASNKQNSLDQTIDKSLYIREEGGDSTIRRSQENRAASMNLSSMLSQQILNENKAASKRSPFPHVSQLTDIENQFLELTQEILLEGQNKLEQQKALESMGRSADRFTFMMSKDGTDDLLKEKFTDADYQIKKSYHELKTLLQNNNSIYQTIEVADVALPSTPTKINRDLYLAAQTNVELLAGLHYFFKVECPLEKDFETNKIKICSPTITFKTNKEKFHLEVFGSFTHRLPAPSAEQSGDLAATQTARSRDDSSSARANQFEVHLKNPEKFTIPEEHGQAVIDRVNHEASTSLKKGLASKGHLTQHDKIPYYLCLFSDEPHGLPLTMKTVIKVKSATVSLLRQKQNKLRPKRCSADPEKTQSELAPIKGSMQQIAMTEKLRHNIELGMANKEYRKELIEKMHELLRRKRIVNFIKNQFGTRNRYLQEFSQVDLEMGKEPNTKFPFQELSRKINENIHSQGKKNAKTLTNAQHDGSMLDRSLKQDLVAMKRNQIDEGKRLKMLEEMNRWDKFRQERDQAIQKYVDAKKQQKIVSQFILQLFYDKYARQVYAYFRQRVHEIKTKQRIVFILKISIGGYKRKMLRFGPTYQKRARNYIRHNLTVGALCCADHYQRKAIAQCLGPFIMEYQYRDAIQQKFRNVIHRVEFIQHRFRRSQSANEAKFKALASAWEKESLDMQKRIKKNQIRNPNFRKLAEAIENVPQDIKEACLRRYLAACKYKHALAFFQWRQRFSVKHDSGLLSAIFNGRVQLLKLKMRLRDEILQDAEVKVEPGGDRGAQKEPSLAQNATKEAQEGKAFDNMKRRSAGISAQDIQADLTTQNVVRIKRLTTSLAHHLDRSEQDEEQELDEDSECLHLINSFEEINLVDPFPTKPQHQGSSRRANRSRRNAIRDGTLAPRLLAGGLDLEDDGALKTLDKSHIDELVYDEKKFTPDAPPSLIFIPNKAVLRKMMKLCTHVNDYTELFYFF